MRALFAAVALFLATPAVAQNQLQSAASPIISTISPAELTAVLIQNGLNATYTGAESGAHFVEINQGGAFVYFALRNCQGLESAARCNMVQPFGFFRTDGVTYAQLNNFNINYSNVAVSGFTTEGRGIIGAKIYLGSGVAQDNMLLQLGLYFMDVDNVLQSISPGTLAQVTFNRPESDAVANGKLANAAGFDIEAPPVAFGGKWRTNAVGANARPLLTDAFRAILERNQ